MVAVTVAKSIDVEALAENLQLLYFYYVVLSVFELSLRLVIEYELPNDIHF